MEPWRIKPHVVLCAALGRGHMTPMVCLARSLASTGAVSVTLVLQTTGALNSLRSSLFSTSPHVTFAVLDEANLNEDPPWMIRVPVSTRIGSSDPSERTLSPAPDFSSLEIRLEALLRKLSPTCLVSDFTLPWTATPANSLKLPRYVLYTDSANFMAVAYHVETLVNQGVLPMSRSSTDRFHVPGVPPLLQGDVARFIWDSTHPYFPMSNVWHRKTVESDGILLNTFDELESSAIEALRNVILPGKNIFTVGPLVSDEESAVFESERDECIRWLDMKPECSVLYVSFGSWEFLPDKQVMELARGLEASGSSFLWVMCLPPGCMNVETLLPEGFGERIKKSGRGLIVTSWAPQQMILKHAAVGGFVTHCGWNSVLEGVCLGGVGMVCWPLVADQLTTCRFLVDGLGVGVEVHEDEEGIVHEKEIERVVRIVMEGDEAENMRGVARRLKERAKNSPGVEKFIENISSI